MNEATYDWYRNMVEQTQRRMSALTELNEDPQRFHGTAESPEGIVATAAPNGAPVDLKISHLAMRLGPVELADAILRTQRTAAANAAERYSQALQDAVPDGVMGRFDTASVREAGESLREQMRTSGGLG